MVWALVLVHWLFGRLARQEVSLPKPSASAGAHEGTVSAMTSPFLTGERRFERELGGLAEVRLQFDERALGDQLVCQVRLRLGAQDRDRRFGCARPRWR